MLITPWMKLIRIYFASSAHNPEIVSLTHRSAAKLEATPQRNAQSASTQSVADNTVR